MRRNARNSTFDTTDDRYANYAISTPGFTTYDTNMWPNSISMETLSAMPARNFNAIEAKVEAGDTLQAIALRFHCSVADIKRLNKIDKENEIHAHKVLKVPLNVHNVLLDNSPTIHNSNSCNSKNTSHKQNHCDIDFNSHDNLHDGNSCLNNSASDRTESNELKLKEQLIVASVSALDLRSASKFSKQEIANNVDDDLYDGK